MKVISDTTLRLGNVLRRTWLFGNPLLWAFISLGITTLFCIAESSTIEPPRFLGFIGRWVLLVPLVALLGGIAATVAFYPLNEKFLGRLIQVYFAVVLLFANAYFLLMVVDNATFAGICSPWALDINTGGPTLGTKSAFLSYVDCLHFSCVTITTLGYGDMRPTEWYSKLLVDLEALGGVGIIVVGIGRYFSQFTPPPGTT